MSLRDIDAWISRTYPNGLPPGVSREQFKRHLRMQILSGNEPKASLTPAEYQKRQLANLWDCVNARDAEEQKRQYELDQKRKIATEARTAAMAKEYQEKKLSVRKQLMLEDIAREKRRQEEATKSRQEYLDKRHSMEGW